ncbi:MAG: pentapeptide repeat-containing protein [Actinomycetota bacterium]
MGAGVTFSSLVGCFLAYAQLSIAMDSERTARDEEQWRAKEHLLNTSPWLSGLDLQGMDLARRHLAGRKLDHALLGGVQLVEANLSGAGLTHADLTGAVLRGADLRNADLSSADLTGADLRGALLAGANLDLAVSDHTTRWPVGTKLIYPSGRTTRIKSATGLV